MNRLHPVADIGKRPRFDDRERVRDIRVLHLLRYSHIDNVAVLGMPPVGRWHGLVIVRFGWYDFRHSLSTLNYIAGQKCRRSDHSKKEIIAFLKTICEYFSS